MGRISDVNELTAISLHLMGSTSGNEHLYEHMVFIRQLNQIIL